jgi:hypothetical protein
MFNVPFTIAEEYLYNGRIYRGKFPISIVENECPVETFIPDSTILEDLDEDEIVKYNIRDLNTGTFLPFQTQELNKSKRIEYEGTLQKKNINLINNVTKRLEDVDSLKDRFQKDQIENRKIIQREKIKENKEIDIGKRKDDVNKERKERVKIAEKIVQAERNANRKNKKNTQKNKKEKDRQKKLAKKR